MFLFDKNHILLLLISIVFLFVKKSILDKDIYPEYFNQLSLH